MKPQGTMSASRAVFCKHGRDADFGAGRRDLADSRENQGRRSESAVLGAS